MKIIIKNYRMKNKKNKKRNEQEREQEKCYFLKKYHSDLMHQSITWTHRVEK